VESQRNKDLPRSERLEQPKLKQIRWEHGLTKEMNGMKTLKWLFASFSFKYSFLFYLTENCCKQRKK
jgi:hypothetical protein